VRSLRARLAAADKARRAAHAALQVQEWGGEGGGVCLVQEWRGRRKRRCRCSERASGGVEHPPPAKEVLEEAEPAGTRGDRKAYLPKISRIRSKAFEGLDES
jgi:hypothetical protein